MYNIIGHRRIFLGIAAILVVASIVAIGMFKFREGIDFRGGTLWSFKAPGADLADVLHAIKSGLGSEDVRLSVAGDDTLLARTPPVTEPQHAELTTALQALSPEFEELSFQSIGPSIGAALRRKAMIALILVLIGISAYIAWAFRKVYEPVSSWKYGVVTLLSLVHDVLIPAGLLAILGHYRGVEIDTNFLVALLVVMGFSVHDTIVVFDRIRENLLQARGKGDFETIVNTSVNQTLGRSINTSLTVILVLLALYFAGPESLHYFVLTLLVGVTTGIYSSIFVASPLLVVWQKLSDKPRKKA